MQDAGRRRPELRAPQREPEEQGQGGGGGVKEPGRHQRAAAAAATTTLRQQQQQRQPPGAGQGPAGRPLRLDIGLWDLSGRWKEEAEGVAAHAETGGEIYTI